MKASHWLTKLCWIGVLICLTGYNGIAKLAEGSYALVGEGFERVVLKVESKFLARARKSAVSGDFDYVNIVFFLADAKGKFEARTIRSIDEQRSYLRRQDNSDRWIEEVLKSGVDVGIVLEVANSPRIFEVTHKKLGIDVSGEFERWVSSDRANAPVTLRPIADNSTTISCSDISDASRCEMRYTVRENVLLLILIPRTLVWRWQDVKILVSEVVEINRVIP